MATRNLEFDYVKNEYEQKESDFYAGDVLIVHFKTPRATQMAPGGHGGLLSLVAHKGPSATRHAVLSLAPGDYDNPVPKGGPLWATTVYFGFNKDARYGIVLVPDTDYYATFENSDPQGQDSCPTGTNCAVLVALNSR